MKVTKALVRFMDGKYGVRITKKRLFLKPRVAFLSDCYCQLSKPEDTTRFCHLDREVALRVYLAYGDMGRVEESLDL